MSSGNENVKIAKVIMQQIGFRRSAMMIGAHSPIAIERGLAFSIKCRGSKANHVTIRLNWLDLYEVRFERARKVVAEHEGVYFDQLVELIEAATGLVCRF